MLKNPQPLAGSAAALAMACCLLHTGAVAEEKPLWEIGLGVSALQLPAYRGAIETRTDVLPIPYLVYRGDHFKADKDGVRGVLFEGDRFEVNLSLAASPPVNSHDVKIREGMPDLKSSLELGPSIDIRLWQSTGRDAKLKLFLPVRAATTLESDPKFIGWQFTPRLNLDVARPFGQPALGPAPVVTMDGVRRGLTRPGRRIAKSRRAKGKG